jgi:hypothetical protein
MNAPSAAGPEIERRNGRILGRAIFIRTDKSDFREQEIPFETMEEMFRLCLDPQKHLSLQRIVLNQELDQKPCSVKLDYVSASFGVIKPK